MKRLLPLLLLATLLAPAARATDADVTGLVPTIWWDFESEPDAAGLPTANKGSASITFTSEGTASYQTGAMNGWAVNTASFTPYSGVGTFSTAGGSFTVSLVMTLGSTANGITWNLRNETGSKDLIVRRGTTSGSLLVGVGPQAQASTDFLEATFADGDAAWHLVSVVVEPTALSLYVDGILADSTTAFTLGSTSGYASQMQFGSHLNGAKTPEARGGGLVDDFRIHDAALTPAQMKAIAVEYGLVSLAIAPFGEPTIGKDSFRTPFVLHLNEGDSAEAAIVYGTDAALSAPATNVIGSALPGGTYTASLTGLASGTTYWWKIVASNGVDRAETDVASFRTLDVIVPEDYAWRVPITVSGYAGTETLTNFPVLVTLAAGTPAGFDYADCAAEGSDLRFAAADGALTPHEIELWDTNGTSYVWVLVPRLPPTGTTLALYYGAAPAGLPAVDPTDVWSRYAVVVHGGSGISDSSPNAIVVANGGGVAATSGSGVAGGGLHKDARNSIGLNIPNPVLNHTLSNPTKFTLTTWYKSAGAGTSCLSASKATWEANGFLLLCEGGTYMAVAVWGHQGATGKGALVKDQWAHVAFSYDTSGAAGSLRTYFDGENIYSNDEAKTSVDGGLAYWTVGSYANTASGDSFVGDMDEIRLFDGIASADWVKAEYDSVADPGAFAVAGAAQPANPNAPRFGASSATVYRSDATFSVTLSNISSETAVSVFYGTAGASFAELPLGTLSSAGTLSATATGLDTGSYVWFARATNTVAGVACASKSARDTFAVTYAKEPTASYKHFTATLSYAGAPAPDVPLLLRLSEDAIDGFRYADVTETGFECIDGNGNLLPWEIDTWDTNGTSLVWVKVPSYADSATVTVRYGGAFANARPAPSEVWSGYVGVWHLGEADGNAQDSTRNGLVAAASGANAEEDSVGVACKIGKGRQMATAKGRKSYLSVADSRLLDCGDSLTFSGWFKASGTYASYSMRYVSRKNAYNDTNGWEAEAQYTDNATTAAKTVSARGASDGDHKTTVPDVRNNWLHLVLVYNGTTLTSYVNGVPQTPLTLKAACSDNDLALSFGNNPAGSESNWCGWMDELRLLSDPVSPAYAVAEYHAMADTNAVSFGAVASVDMGDPRISAPVVERLSDGTFRVTAEISQNEPVAGSVKCVAGGAEFPMTTADATLPATYSADLANLAAGTCTATVQAQSSGGSVVSRTAVAVFHAGALVVSNVADADEATLSPGTFRISRADADSTGLPALTFDVAFSGPGLAAVVPPTVTTLTIPAGAAYVDVSVTPIYTTAVDANATLTLTVSGDFIGTPSSGSITILNAIYDPAVRYVATTGDDANHGGTPESPKKTISAAVSSLANIVQTLPCTVHVAPGLYKISSPINVTDPIRILGASADPSMVVVSNTVASGNASQEHRVFIIANADALVANLTMQKGEAYNRNGGNFCIGSAGGMVSNCVVEAGYARDNGLAAGAWLDGGIVTHTVFRRNASGSGSVNWQGNRPGVLQLKGSARAENCLFVGNNQYAAVTLINVDGSSVMRNCTIVDSSLAATNGACKAWSALKIDSGATVQNVVIAGVTNKVDGLPCPPTGTVLKFRNGAFDGDATGLPEGTVVGTAAAFFPHYAENVPYELKYRPQSGGPLYDAGANYTPMARFDLSGVQKRKVGSHVDIGCYEANAAGTLLLIK